MSEQEKLREDLLAEYGEAIVGQAYELSGLSTCIVSLGCDELTVPQRERLRDQSIDHLTKLLCALLKPGVGERVFECAKRIDAAIETWAVDAIEQREGLPRLNLTRE